ncbi:hypothetical protein V6N13_082850 [Hibiscus sabdariffa]|uniref:F-box associated domain-containing protein n=1 Tax=Hibiscus sabdariffa TaxID=183260 RepID=A0ABR2BZR2_9ROSI
MWLSTGGIDGLVLQNLVILMETRNGDGIEAWVTLDEHFFPPQVVFKDTETGNRIEALVYFDEQHMVMLEQNEEHLCKKSIQFESGLLSLRQFTQEPNNKE